MDSERVVGELRAEFERLNSDLKAFKLESVERHERLAREEFEAFKRVREASFARRFVMARRLGLKRRELDLPVLKTRDGVKYKYFEALGEAQLDPNYMDNLVRLNKAFGTVQAAGLSLSRREVAVNLGLDPDDYTM